MEIWQCATCGVERSGQPGAQEVCPICADERQYVPLDGQRWTTLAAQAANGAVIDFFEVEPWLFGLTSSGAGIGQQAMLLITPAGNVLWDPISMISDAVVEQVKAHGEVVAIAASHPHMFGVQVEWARALGARVLVNQDDAQWLQRPDGSIDFWSGSREVVPGVTLHQVGGHFKGSAVLHWPAGNAGKGILLAGDSIFVNQDRTAAFMRSYPNKIPLSAAVVDRIATTVQEFAFDRLYNNFGSVLPHDAPAVVRRSADRHIAWVRGDFDHLT